MIAKTGNAESGRRNERQEPGRKEDKTYGVTQSEKNETEKQTGRTNGATQAGGNNQRGGEQKKQPAIRRDDKGATELGRQNEETETGTPRLGTRNRKDVGTQATGRL